MNNKTKKFLSIFAVWIIYIAVFVTSYKLGNIMLFFAMIMATITMIPFILTVNIIDYFDNKEKIFENGRK